MVIYVWPDGEWCVESALGSMSWKSDDYERIVLEDNQETYCQNDARYYQYNPHFGVLARDKEKSMGMDKIKKEIRLREVEDLAKQIWAAGCSSPEDAIAKAEDFYRAIDEWKKTQGEAR